MTLAEMRTLLRANIDDDGAPTPDLASDAKADAWLNASLQCVCNWADSQDQMLFHNTAFVATTGTPPSSGYHTVYFTSASGTPNFNLTAIAPFRRLLGIMVEAAGQQAVPLQVVEFEKRDVYKTPTQSLTPPLCIVSDGIMLLNPQSGFPLRMHYVQSMPAMTAGTDTPGQVGGVGRANLLPIEYHPLVVAYATVMALNAENSDSERWMAAYGSMQENLLVTLQRRRGARVDKT